MLEMSKRRNSDVSNGNSALQNFSPVKSPMGASPLGNLIGIPRKIKDSCADVFNYLQKWNSFVIVGTAILRQICNKRIENVGVESCQDLADPVYADSLMSLFSQLEDNYLHLESIVKKLQDITVLLEAVATLDKRFTGNTSPLSIRARSTDDIVFETWPAERFYEIVQALWRMYRKELNVKKRIKEEIVHHKNEATLTFFVALWTHQVYIEEKSKDMIEMMLVECGFH